MAVLLHPALEAWERELLNVNGYRPAYARVARRNARVLVECTGVDDLNDLTRDGLIDAIGVLRERTYSQNTIRLHVYFGRRFVRWLTLTDRIDSDPAATIPLPRREERPVNSFSTAQVKALFAAADGGRWPTRDRLVLALSFTCGLRRGEIAGLRVNDILSDADEVPQSLRITGKGGRFRLVPLPGATSRVLAQYLRERADVLIDRGQRDPGPLLLATHDCHSPILSYGSLGDLFTRLARRAGIDGKRFKSGLHAARRTFATQSLRGGMHPVVLSEICGWVDATTATRYIVAEQEDLRRGMDSNPLLDHLDDKVAA